ncbi:CEP19-like protein-domain-containing protein [Pelagophyceae sp. CCMP2097]|nr:CEP19-like protein-domain-containing protein [Pelagophyceae sp. CCMP2097]
MAARPARASTSPARGNTQQERDEMASLSPRRLALKYAPPTVILEYAAPSRGYLHYAVRLRHLDGGMEAEKITLKLFARHPRYFDPAKVKHHQVKKLIERLLARLPDPEPGAAADFAALDRRRNDPLLTGTVDLNQVSEAELVRAKAMMTVDYDLNRIKPGDAQYVYDKQADFQQDEDCGWDDDEDDDD